MTRVAMVGFHLDRAGREPDALLEAWHTLPGVAGAVARAGVDVTVIQPAHRHASFERDGVAYRFVAERPALFRRGAGATRPVRLPASRVVDAVAAAAPDIVHVNGLTVPAGAMRVRKRLPDVGILAQDHADRPPSLWRRPAARRAMRAYDAAAFTAREQAEQFFEARLFPPDLPVYEVPESSTDFAPGSRPRAREATGIHGDPCLLWLGNLDANKDPLTTLDGFAAAVADLPDARLWCHYRRAPLLDAVERRVRDDPRLRDRVRLLGPCPHERVEAVLRAADALVQGSHWEGSGYAVIEAMACGATPVVTDIPPFRRLTGDVGRLWEPGDAEALAAALRRLAGDDPRGPRGRRDRVRRHFERALSWDALGRRLVEVYAAVLAGAPSEDGRAP